MKRSSLFALAIAATTVLSFGAQAGSVIEYSSTWKPGFEYDDGTRQYTRMTYVDENTGYNPGSKFVTVTETSSTAKPGFYADDNNTYSRTVQVPNKSQAPVVADKSPHEQNTWDPKHQRDDSGVYISVN